MLRGDKAVYTSIFKMHVSLTSYVQRHEHACTTCLEINLIPINKKISLHDPSITYSEKYDSEPNLKQTHIIHVHKYLNILVLLQVPKPVFPETCSLFFTLVFA